MREGSTFGNTARDRRAVGDPRRYGSALLVADDVLEGLPRMAVSLEPEARPATQGPEGPVLATGECMKIW